MQAQDNLSGVMCYIFRQCGHRKADCPKYNPNYKNTRKEGSSEWCSLHKRRLIPTMSAERKETSIMLNSKINKVEEEPSGDQYIWLHCRAPPLRSRPTLHASSRRTTTGCTSSGECRTATSAQSGKVPNEPTRRKSTSTSAIRVGWSKPILWDQLHLQHSEVSRT